MARLPILLFTLVLVTIAATNRVKHGQRLSSWLKVKKGLQRYGRRYTAQPNAAPSLRNTECGMLPADRLSKRIIGGKTADAHKWPSVCRLLVMKPLQNRKVYEADTCGSTLVKNQKGVFYIITAVHCLKHNTDPNSYSVRCGIHNLFGDSVSHEQRLKVKRITVHNDYVSMSNPDIRAHDIAVLELSTQPTENDFVQAACLPTKPPAVNDSAVVVGWGIKRVGNNMKTRAMKLQELVIPIIGNKECEDMMNANGDAYVNCKEQGFVCAGFTKAGKGACNGDSGGPLYLRSEGRWTLIGVVSFVVGQCAEDSNVDAFVDVFSHLEWINDKINN